MSISKSVSQLLSQYVHTCKSVSYSKVSQLGNESVSQQVSQLTSQSFHQQASRIVSHSHQFVSQPYVSHSVS